MPDFDVFENNMYYKRSAEKIGNRCPRGPIFRNIDIHLHHQGCCIELD